MVPSPKIVINLPGTSEKLPCKEEPDRFKQTYIMLLRFFSSRGGGAFFSVNFTWQADGTLAQNIYDLGLQEASL